MHALLALTGFAGRRVGTRTGTSPPARLVPSLLAGVLAAACAQVPRLPHRFVSEHAEVHARSAEHAEAVADWIGEITAPVKEKLGTRREAPRVYVAPDLLPENFQGRCYTTHVVVDGRHPFLEMQIVLHEITHWYAEPLRRQLSQPLFEGLADAMVAELDPRYATGFLQYRLAHALASAAVPGVLERTERELRTPIRPWQLRPPRTSDWSEAVGYVLVSRIGADRVKELCAESRARGERTVPLERWLAAAGFERLDTAEMRAIVEELLRETEGKLAYSALWPPP